MKRNIYLSQFNVTFSNFAYLPYGAGCLAAYAWNDDEIKSKFSLGELFFMREKPEEVMERLDNPFIFGFSCLVWNMEYNKVLAKKIKEKYPDCFIVFGGHNIPFDTSVLEECSYEQLMEATIRRNHAIIGFLHLVVAVLVALRPVWGVLHPE